MAPASNEISHNIKERKLKLSDSEALAFRPLSLS
jgi:hypothetical protein